MDPHEVRHLLGEAYLRGLGEQHLLQDGICYGVIQRPRQFQFSGPALDLHNGLLGSANAVQDASLRKPHRRKPENLTILGHKTDSL